MGKLSFHKDKNFFMDWLLFNDMTTGEIVLWHTLMNIGNRLGQRSIFNAPTYTLMKLTGLSKQGVINARNKLLERGFIHFKKGEKNKAPVYEMLPIHERLENYFSFSHNARVAQHIKEQGQALHTRESSSSKEAESLYQAFKENVNKVTPIIKEEIMRWLNVYEANILEEAIRITALKGGKTFSYTKKILEEWQQHNLKNLDEIKNYELVKEKKLIPFHTGKQEEVQFRVRQQEEGQLRAEKHGEGPFCAGKHGEGQSLDEWLKEEFQ